MKSLTLSSRGVLGSLSTPVRVAVNWPFTIRPFVRVKLLVRQAALTSRLAFARGAPDPVDPAFQGSHIEIRNYAHGTAKCVDADRCRHWRSPKYGR